MGGENRHQVKKRGRVEGWGVSHGQNQGVNVSEHVLQDGVSGGGRWMERSENAVCARCLRGFNTPVCGQGVKTRSAPLFPNIHEKRCTHSHTQNLLKDLFYNNLNSTHTRTYMKRLE